MNKLFKVLAITVVGVSTLFSSQKDERQAGNDHSSLVQVAVLLDASNSMDGLINQAKSQLWKIVNEFARAKKSGKTPNLEVAFFEYGKSSLSVTSGYLRMITPFTTDLDKVSEELFALTTNGGDEYCGKVIERAVQELSWSESPEVYKAIFIAGNEPFSQGSTDYKKACKSAIKKGIIVNTIFCGNRSEGIESNWKDGADLADGNYFSINQDEHAAHIKAPQDSAILHLNKKLNVTYIAFGSHGAVAKRRQEVQDRKAASLAPEVAVQRAMAKSSKQYRNESWDLVEAEEAGRVDVAEMRDEDLPKEMQSMSESERKAYIEKKAEERKKIQKQIKNLQREREKYVAKEQAKTGKNTLDKAIIGAIRTQSAKKGFVFED